MYRRVAILYLGALFALSVYRAATQSFTTDEAHSYRLYIGAEPFSLLRLYDANLHVLHTALTWASVKLLGLSEFTFRLPSLGACLLYFAGVYRLCASAFGRGLLFLIGTALLTTSPLVLDHMAIGRGYGLALAFFAWAFGEALRAAREDGAGLFRVGVLLSMSVASNLTFLFPAAALGATLILWRPRFPRLVSDFAGPSVVFTCLMVVLPFSRIGPGQFYFGSETFTMMTQPLIEMAIGGRHLNPNWVNAGVILLVAASAVAAVILRGNPPHDRFLPLAANTLALTAAGVAASHLVFGLPYPWGRTGIYFLALSLLFALAAADRLYGWPRLASNALLAGVWLIMATGITANRYLEWSFDASNREIIEQIRDRQSGARAHVRIAASPPLDLTLDLYRRVYRLDRITAIEAEPFAPGYDYYVLRDGDRSRAAELGLREIFASGVSGSALAVPADAR